MGCGDALALLSRTAGKSLKVRASLLKLRAVRLGAILTAKARVTRAMRADQEAHCVEAMHCGDV